MAARFPLVLALVLALGISPGCFKSSTTQASSESSSNFVSSPFKSSSGSSSGEDEEETEETAYQRDVRHVTAGFARLNGDLDVLQRDLSAIAESYGITDWERADATYVAIGRGLADSSVDDWTAKRTAVALSNRDHERLALIWSGFEHPVDR